VSRSLAFDRAAGFYDRTRTLTPEVRARLAELLSAELRGHEPVLEVGVGTGRIALPLHKAGLGMVGIDLSEPMLRKLVANAGGRAPFPICIADATRLPFPPNSFGGALVAHVLHLIPSWRYAIDELFRVLRGEAVLVVDVGGRSEHEGAWAQIVARFAREAGIERRNRGVGGIDQLAAEMEARGATHKALEPVDNSRETSYEAMLEHLADGLSSFTWQIDEPARRQAADRARTWARSTFGDLNAKTEVRDDIRFHTFVLP
jgi:ubiquinone/menaquinone biosynthesis C-methylase UbiE